MIRSMRNRRATCRALKLFPVPLCPRARRCAVCAQAMGRAVVRERELSCGGARSSVKRYTARSPIRTADRLVGVRARGEALEQPQVVLFLPLPAAVQRPRVNPDDESAEASPQEPRNHVAGE